MKVIGTAGHIDHGKSALVRALTGIDPDRLEEEKRRGMTIDLGFAWLTLPSGVEVSIVDVPGHERFIKNMLAGAGGIDLALLVVAADESVMPQTREHLDILDLLGVRHGLVALTKADLVEQPWLDLVTADVLELLAGTRLEGSPIVPVSSTTGAGVPELLRALDERVAQAPERRDIGLPLVPIDRVFTVSGFGTVVTGTLQDGILRTGEEVEFTPGRRRARIRGLQTHQRQVDAGFPGDRVAVNVAGVDRELLARGQVLAARGSVVPVRRFDARLSVVGDAPFPLYSGLEVAVHAGSAERQAVLSLLGTEEVRAGQTSWVSLRLDGPLAVAVGQRYIVRLPAPARTVAGGEIVYMGVPIRPRAQRLEVLEGLASPNPQERAVSWLRAVKVTTPDTLALGLRMPAQLATEMLEQAASSGDAVRIGEEYMVASEWARLSERASDALRRYHEAQPLERGMPKEEFRARLRCPAEQWPAVLELLEAHGVIRDSGPVVSGAWHTAGLTARRDEADRLVECLRGHRLSPPPGAQVCAECGCEPALLKALTDAAEIVHVGNGLYFARDVFDAFARDVLALIDREGSVSVARVRDELGTSRKFVLALLEHLDALRVTRRVGDERVRGSRASACA